MFGTDLSSYINGAVVSLSLWFKKINDLNLIKIIGIKLKELLGFPNGIIYEVKN
jgi:hypothetical protein